MIFEEKKFVQVMELLGNSQEVNILGRYRVEAGKAEQAPPQFFAIGQIPVPVGGNQVQMVQFPVVLEGAVTPAEAFALFPVAFMKAKERAEAELRQRALMTAAVPPGIAGRINGRDLRG